MKVSLIKTADGTWMPLTPCKVLDQAGAGEERVAEVKRQRNGRYNRLVFLWLKAVLDNQDKYQTVDQLRTMLLLRTGRVKEIMTDVASKSFTCRRCGHCEDIDIDRTVLIPESMSYENMNQDEFEQLQKDFDQALLDDGINLPLGEH